LEPLAKDTERYVFINVPYNFMFTCKARQRSLSYTLAPCRAVSVADAAAGPAQISNPARLCAVFERADTAAA